MASTGSTSCLRNGLAPALVINHHRRFRPLDLLLHLADDVAHHMRRQGGDAVLLAVLDGSFRRLCSTRRSVKKTRSSPVGERYGFTSVRRMLCRTYSVSSVVFFVLCGGFAKRFQDGHAIADRHAFAQQILQDFLNAR